jgi:F-type H+-transporting ATPase subunit delta
MQDKTLATTYANALYGAALAADSPPAILADLERVRASLAAVPLLKKVFCHPVISSAEKAKLAVVVFSGTISVTCERFLSVLFKAKRIALLEAIYRAFRARFNKENNRTLVTVTSSRPLPGDLVKTINSRLAVFLGTQVEITQKVDERLLGGIKLDIGGTVIDGSTDFRLGRLAEKMLAG